jgi:hypothetical protein
MNEEEHLTCPDCGASVSRTDWFCKACGKELSPSSGPVQNEPAASSEPVSEQAYERKYSVFQRFYRLVVSPSAAMKDIGLSPDYAGPVLLVILESILGVVAISLAFQKIQITGDSQMVSQVQGFVSLVMTIAAVFVVVYFLVAWLVKSLIVKYSCDGGSGWSFGTTASVTGYAYLADFIVGVISLIIVYPLLPSLTLNVSDVTAATQAVANFQAQIQWTRLLIAIPLGLVSLIWKSHLGALGTKFGTHERTSRPMGFTVFLVLALFGWLISFLLRGTI